MGCPADNILRQHILLKPLQSNLGAAAAAVAMA